MPKILYFLLVLMLTISITSCHKSSSSNPKGYIVTSPEISEIICFLDGFDNIIGITKECNFPSELSSKTIIGTFGKIDIEKVISLNPELVFTTGIEQEKLSADLNKLGIKTEKIYINSMLSYLEAVKKIGKIIEIEEKALNYCKNLEKDIESLKNNPKNNLKVYVEIYGSPIMSVSDNSLVGELINIAGGKNIFPILPRDYSKVNSEDVVNLNPDIILLTYPGVTKENVKSRKGWSNISAIKNNRIYTIDDVDPDLILRATPRTILGIQKLKEIINE